MNYGFDLDTVCFDFQGPFKKYIETEYSTTIKDEEITRWYWNECIPWISKESFDFLFDRFVKEGHFRHLKPRIDAKLAVRRCQEKGHDVFFLTSRSTSLTQQTRDSVREHFGPFNDDHIIVTGGRKSSFCKKHDIDVFIDDSPHHAIDIYVHSPTKVYMLDWPYNRMIHVDDPEKFIRVSSLYDFCIKENLI